MATFSSDGFGGRMRVPSDDERKAILKRKAEGEALLKTMLAQFEDVKRLKNPRTDLTHLDEVIDRLRTFHRGGEAGQDMAESLYAAIRDAVNFRFRVERAIREEKATQDKIIAESKARQKERNQASALAAEKRDRSAIKAFMKSEK